MRFAAALAGIREDEIGSIIDFGCGFGDLLGYLWEKGWKGHYKGVDLVDELVSEARRRYAQDRTAKFVCADTQNFDGSDENDMAVALGIFNYRFHQDNRTFVRETVDAMWRTSVRVVVCDFLDASSELARRQEDLYYADPCQIYELASAYSPRVMIHHAYMPFEFQVKIWHDDAFEVYISVFGSHRHLASAQSEWRIRGRCVKNDPLMPG